MKEANVSKKISDKNRIAEISNMKKSKRYKRLISKIESLVSKRSSRGYYSCEFTFSIFASYYLKKCVVDYLEDLGYSHEVECSGVGNFGNTIIISWRGNHE